MAVDFRAQGADESATSNLIACPVDDGLIYFGYYGGTEELTIRNLADGTRLSVLVGGPTISPAFISCKAFSKYLQTPYLEPSDATFMCVARVTDTQADNAHRPVFGATYGTMVNPPGGGPRTGGLLMYDSVIGIIRGQGDDQNDSQNRVIAPVDVTSFRMYALRLSDKVYMDELTGGATQTPTTFDQPPRQPSGLSLRIGSSNSVAFQGTCDVAFGALWNRKLTDVELNTILLFVRSYLSDKGITV